MSIHMRQETPKCGQPGVSILGGRRDGKYREKKVSTLAASRLLARIDPE
jgi:hypothetical protein